MPKDKDTVTGTIIADSEPESRPGEFILKPKNFIRLYIRSIKTVWTKVWRALDVVIMDSLETYEIGSKIGLGLLPHSDKMTRVSAKVLQPQCIAGISITDTTSQIQLLKSHRKKNMVPSLKVVFPGPTMIGLLEEFS